MSEHRNRRDRNDWEREDEWRRAADFEQGERGYRDRRSGRDYDYERGWDAGRMNYGDDRDAAFQRGRTSQPGSMGRYESERGSSGGSVTDESYTYDRGYDPGRRGYGSRGRMGRSGDYRYGDEGSRRDYGYQSSYQGGDYGYEGGRGSYQGSDYGYQGDSGMYGLDSGRIQLGSQGGRYAGRGPKGYQRSDERIHEEVCEILTRHGDIDASNMEIRVQGGEVTLEGTVNDRYMKRMAEDAIISVSGVRDVHNNLRSQQGWQANDWQHQQQGNQAGQSGQMGQMNQMGQQSSSQQSSSQERSSSSQRTQSRSQKSTTNTNESG